MASKRDIGTDARRKILERIRSDDAFRARLRTDTAAALASLGISVPSGVTITFVEDTATVWHFVIPANREGELSDAELDRVAGGAAMKHIGNVKYSDGL